MAWLHPREPLHHIDDSKRGRLREMVFGVEDGLVSTMGVITGIAAGTGSRLLVLLSGLVVIFVEALSMGAGSYLSGKSEAELEDKMLKEELHEIRHHPEKERRELHEFYSVRGFSREEQKILVDRFMSDEDLLLEEMAHKELGIFPGRTHDHLGNALVMWGSYMVGGAVPLLPYAVLAAPTSDVVLISVAATALALFALGVTKGRLVGIKPLKSGFEMFGIGMGAAGIGWIVGRIASHLLGTVGT